MSGVWDYMYVDTISTDFVETVLSAVVILPTFSIFVWKKHDVFYSGYLFWISYRQY
jgi:hypothetical protein